MGWLSSGYGVQTDLFTKRFQAAGHDVAIVANHGLHEKPTTWNGIPVFPQFGEDSIQTFAKHWEADVVILLYDTWVMHPDAWPEVEMAMWAPIDHWPIPPEVLNVLQHERVRPIAMSRFGQTWLQNFSLGSLYAPHGIDTEVFKPMPEIRGQVREMLEIPEDAFLVGMVAANSGWNPHVSRKSFPQAFDAFGRFLKAHKDAYLYVHTKVHGGATGQDLLRLAKVMEIPEERFRSPQVNAWYLGVMDDAFLAGVYNTFDVLLNPSMGEGFGVPIIEAQACGVPVITCDHSAMTELTHAGWLVQGDRWWDEIQVSFAIMPAVASIYECLRQAYKAREDEALRKKARKFALEYDADRVAETYWKPVLEELAKPREVKPFPKESRQVRRAREREAAKA